MLKRSYVLGLKSLDISVSRVTRLRNGIPMVRVSIPDRVKRIFFAPKPHDLLWCPFSPLLTGGAYPGNKAVEMRR
jgi:hypothetical protein